MASKAPTFTRQHFEFIADALKTARRGLARADAPGLRLIEWDAFFVPSIADELAKTNASFDRKRFIEACDAVPETF